MGINYIFANNPISLPGWKTLLSCTKETKSSSFAKGTEVLSCLQEAVKDIYRHCGGISGGLIGRWKPGEVQKKIQ